MNDDDRYTRITLRIPKELHASLAERADATSKSLNAEIVARLDESFLAQHPPEVLEERLAAAEQRAQILEQAVESERARANATDWVSQILAANVRLALGRLPKELLEGDEVVSVVHKMASSVIHKDVAGMADSLSVVYSTLGKTEDANSFRKMAEEARHLGDDEFARKTIDEREKRAASKAQKAIEFTGLHPEQGDGKKKAKS